MLSRLAAVALLLTTFVVAACDTSGLPTAPGRYTLKDKSVSFDGEKYNFWWADAANQLHHADTDDVKLQLDESNFLEVTADKDAVLHLRQDEPVTVEGRDRQGDFGNFWYPFLIGSMLSRGSGPVIVNNQPLPGEYRQPTYRYPPTDSFDRGDTIGGSVATNRPKPPDYNRLPPVSDAVSGQTGGAGGGNAATNRSDTGVSGQAGGTGTGSAALSRSGSFRTGSQGFDAKVEGNSGTTKVGGGSGALSGKPSISTGKSSSTTSVRPSTSSRSVPKISTGRRR